MKKKEVKHIFFKGSLIIIRNTFIKVEFSQSAFLKNNMNFDLIDILYSKKLEINELYCKNNNLLKTDYFHELKGGFLRAGNILKREIINLFITDSFSTQTNIGLKIIDSQMDLEIWLKSFYNLQPYDVHIIIK